MIHESSRNVSALVAWIFHAANPIAVLVCSAASPAHWVLVGEVIEGRGGWRQRQRLLPEALMIHESSRNVSALVAWIFHAANPIAVLVCSAASPAHWVPVGEVIEGRGRRCRPVDLLADTTTWDAVAPC